MTLKDIWDSWIWKTSFASMILVLLFVNLFSESYVLNIICGSLMIVDTFWTKHLYTIGKRILSKMSIVIDSCYCLAGMNLLVFGLAKVIGS